MSTPHSLKDTWRGNGAKRRRLAEALNKLARWCNLLEVDPPLRLGDSGGFVRLGLDPSALTREHPWQITLAEEDGEFSVRAGRVHDGLEWHEVDALEDVAFTVTEYVWLRVKYYNNPATPSEYELAHGAALPESDYDAPALSTSAALTTGWVEVIVPVGSVDAVDGVSQYLMEDVLLPYGKTYTGNKHVGWSYAEDVLYQVVQVATVVRSQEIALGSPVSVALFETGPCP
jgi:hypothetical protein